ncbi:hypothetical protein LguiA_032435 [Lonicera macranthoides]
MEKENPAARRRVNVITAHFTTTTAAAYDHTPLFPMNCSSSLNSVIQRRDNKTYFARQGSSSQACFMRQVSTEQGSSSQGGVPLKCTGTPNEGSPKVFEAPLFSRATSLEPKIPNAAGVFPPLVQDSKLSATEPPQFSRANRRINGGKRLCSKTKIHALSSGSKWNPRFDVAESGRIYLVTVELPGVNVNDIRVEVNDKTVLEFDTIGDALRFASNCLWQLILWLKIFQLLLFDNSLTVTGNRKTQRERVTSDPPQSVYHKREILQGPYKVMWSLPPNVDKDGVIATFV